MHSRATRQQPRSGDGSCASASPQERQSTLDSGLTQKLTSCKKVSNSRGGARVSRFGTAENTATVDSRRMHLERLRPLPQGWACIPSFGVLDYSSGCKTLIYKYL